MEYFGFVADCRARLKPAVPANYFGNCVALGKAELKHGEVKKGGPDGFVKVAKAIGEAIRKSVNNENGILCGAEKWPVEYRKLDGKRWCGVVGSPRFDFYTADYGWGKAKKFEALFIDDGAALSLCKSRDFEGGLEFGLSKPMAQMDAFSRVFREVLGELLQFKPKGMMS
ncbi:anthocyanin 5-aromatic acyltransferase [Phtheirospermum japonicum]|uniref:Anthocyanin 5-aromatic acyltransferase n=1 Tax=Phtheirospermum japonicum TaxID=374723 RepID=A0A830BLU0_9LAMI|nr:anthocyanin 5-aromatic acyltransferase [Phtheirospermum japonicum]